MSVMRGIAILGHIVSPWAVLLYVHLIGLHWTLIGCGLIYGLAAVIALAIVIDRSVRQATPSVTSRKGGR